MHKHSALLHISLVLLLSSSAFATTIVVNPKNYTSSMGMLAPGDTMLFSAGVYLARLNIRNVLGVEGREIVFRGESQSSVVFKGDACCNTVSLTQSGYIKIMDITIDGQNIDGIDGIKAEGTAGNW